MSDNVINGADQVGLFVAGCMSAAQAYNARISDVNAPQMELAILIGAKMSQDEIEISVLFDRFYGTFFAATYEIALLEDARGWGLYRTNELISKVERRALGGDSASA